MHSCLGIQPWTSTKELGGLVVLTTGILQYARGGTREEGCALTHSASLMPHNRPVATKCLLTKQLPWLEVELLLSAFCPPGTGTLQGQVSTRHLWALQIPSAARGMGP